MNYSKKSRNKKKEERKESWRERSTGSRDGAICHDQNG